MQTKHFVNDPEKLVEAALKSHCIIRPDLRLDVKNKILYSPTSIGSPGKVSIISGGGSGHEPAFTGFVGEGALAASVAGTIFASPSSKQVLHAIEGVDASKGILVTVMNYTGDVLNFGVALEKAKAGNPNLKIEMLVVGDDVGVPRSRAGKVGRRGIAGTVLVHKITGALAAAGSDLDEVSRVGRLVASNLASIGVSLSRVHVPGRPHEDTAQDSLGAAEVELGMGIHNESGCGRRSGADAELPILIRDMLQQVLDPSDADRNYLPQGCQEVVLLVNNLGALSVLELGAVITEVTEQVQRIYKLKILRLYSGTFMTSLDGPGFSISLLNVVDTGVQQSLLDLLDAPSNIPGWHVTRPDNNAISHLSATQRIQRTQNQEELPKTSLNCDMVTTLKHLQNGLSAIIAAEPEITKYDDLVGDGDCGTTLKRGAESISNSLTTSPPSDVVGLLSQVTDVVENTMDGTSGALYAIFLNNLTHYFKLRTNESTSINAGFWIEALTSTLASLSKYTPADVGDRTMMDALIPFVLALKTSGDLKQAAQAAKEGALKTMSMRPGLGRTVYIGNEDTWMGKIPDPGAWGLKVFFEGLAE